MKSITFTADEHIIQAAREQAAADQTTLNEQFRRWLEQYARQRRAAKSMEVVRRVSERVDLDCRRFTRDEINERR